MRHKNDLILQLSPVIFWDTHISKLDYKKHRDFIIERVVVYGNENDEILLYKLYTWRQVRRSVIKSDSLTETAINYISTILDIKKEKFKCYTNILSHLTC
jgi:hypothetical protein